MTLKAKNGDPILHVEQLAKDFTLHLHGGKVLPVLEGVSFDLWPGECVVLGGASGIGKSSILKMIYGNYLAREGEVLVRDGDRLVNVVTARPAEIMALRRNVMGYVSQFLRVIPRVSALDVVAEPARGRGMDQRGADFLARSLLDRLNLPERLWALPPATFSGGEQQRVNIARGFAGHHPLMILDEPTASLDARNREAVIQLIKERKAQGAAFIGIFHDAEVRDAVADRIIDVTAYAARQQA
jgi:alpha-D-ribose 1-methylphosphonate 5-triphosphate synthase subunit PhnL